MPDFIPYGQQWIDDSEIEEVVKVLKSDWITQGPKVKEFERALADYCGAKYAVVFSSGTAALHGAYFAIGLQKGDEIITSPITFVATSNAALFLGANVIFSDIEEETVDIDINLIEDKITEKTKAIVPVHFAGQPVDMDEILDIAKRHEIFVIEDACHALGSQYRCQISDVRCQKSDTGGNSQEETDNGQGTRDKGLKTTDKEQRTKDGWIKVGSCSHSDMAVFSFHPVKNITTGEGGAVLTNTKDLYEKLIMFRHHGITKNPEKFVSKDSAFAPHAKRHTLNADPWYYEMHYLGNNYRLTDFQCALGISQLRKLDNFVLIRREIVKWYNEALEDIEEIEPIKEKDNRISAWHIYVIKLRLERLKKTRREIFDYLRSKGIGVHVHYLPVYWHPYYQKLGYKKGLCPIAEGYYQRAITLPVFPSLKKTDIKRIIEAIKDSLNSISL